eukprot:gene15468-22167_t
MAKDDISPVADVAINGRPIAKKPSEYSLYLNNMS